MNAAKLLLPATVALGALVLGCGPSRRVFKGDGYHDPERAYQIISVDGSGALLSPTKWSLTNYENVDGRVGARKDTAEYAVWQRFDTTGDGNYDSEIRQALYDAGPRDDPARAAGLAQVAPIRPRRGRPRCLRSRSHLPRPAAP